MSGFIRLAPDPSEPAFGLSRDEALTQAKAAFQRAWKAQMRLVSNLGLTESLTEPGDVDYAALRLMRADAERQVERAQAVVVALIESMEALERYREDRR